MLKKHYDTLDQRIAEHKSKIEEKILKNKEKTKKELDLLKALWKIY